MNYQDKTRDELLKELQKLHEEHISLKNSYELDIAAHILATQELKISEEKFRKAFITSPDSININRLEDGMYISVNKGFTKISGYTEEEVVGKTSLELDIWFDPADRERLVNGLKEKGEVENMETRFLMKNGSVRTGIMSATVIDLNGVPHILSITRDITDRMQAALALQQSENKYRELIELAVDGILLGAPDGTVIGANSYMLNLTGRSLDSLLGLNISELFDPGELKKVPLRFDLLLKGETVINERNILRPDGSMIQVEMHTKMMPDGSYQSIYHDITDRKESEKALQESEEWFRNLFEQSTDGILYLSSDGKIITSNKSFAEMHGYELEEILRMSIGDLDCPEQKQFFSERMTRLSKGENLKFEVEHFHKDGHRFPLEVTTAMITMGSTNYILASHRDITEHRKAKQSLLESEEKLKSIFRAAPVGIGLVVDRVFMEVNDAFCKMTGYTRKNLIGKHADMIYPTKEISDHVGVEKYRQIAEKGTGSVETLFKRKDGSIINVIMSSTPIDKNDMSKGVTFTVLDVTDRHDAEESLKLSEEKFRSIADNLTDVIFLTDTEGIITYISPSCKIFGYSVEDFIGTFFGQYLAESDIQKAIVAFTETLISDNPTHNLQLVAKRKDGTSFFAELNGSALIKGNEKVGVLGLLRDITERKNMEAAVVASEQRYRELFLNNPAPTYIFDVETLEFIEVNEATIRIYGYSREEFTSMTLKDFRLQEDLPALYESLEGLGENVFHSTSMRHKRKDGTAFPVEITSHALPEKNGRKTRLVIVQDITERVRASEQMKLAKEKAEASDKLKTSFLNNISHEVRTPLNGILGFAEIMAQPDLPEKDKNECITMLFDSSDRLLNTITNYMDISLLTSGNLTVYKKDFIPGTVLRKIYDNYYQTCSNRKLELLLELPGQKDYISVNSDTEIFQKIISHLLNNAIKFTEKGSIKFGYKIHNEYLEFFVKDTGVGIGRESVETVFDHFAKEDRGPLKITEGSGLGLSISKGMVEILGGRIWVESEREKGSSFYFTIPKSKEILTEKELRQEVLLKTDRVTSTILVAEDDVTNFLYIQALLKQNTSAKILHALNGKEAVEIFLKNPDIDLILMDIKMPVMNGIEATRQIKAISPQIPIIAITAYAMAGDETRILDAGCDHYLTKPIDKKQLFAKMTEYLVL
jgi:PAS domain S-box-containing protein